MAMFQPNLEVSGKWAACGGKKVERVSGASVMVPGGVASVSELCLLGSGVVWVLMWARVVSKNTSRGLPVAEEGCRCGNNGWRVGTRW